MLLRFVPHHHLPWYYRPCGPCCLLRCEQGSLSLSVTLCTWDRALLLPLFCITPLYSVPIPFIFSTCTGSAIFHNRFWTRTTHSIVSSQSFSTNFVFAAFTIQILLNKHFFPKLVPYRALYLAGDLWPLAKHIARLVRWVAIKIRYLEAIFNSSVVYFYYHTDILIADTSQQNIFRKDAGILCNSKYYSFENPWSCCTAIYFNFPPIVIINLYDPSGLHHNGSFINHNCCTFICSFHICSYFICSESKSWRWTEFC